ncbi:MAG: PAS domain S-box protein [Ignavibacteriae bacterium]|jgi:PAS domain S-box-containing protein|nr:PAS domain S-box protein [Ignavibacteriota bacterium]NOH00314.1 PAS domain S-box protein [Ignavibacteriota bacterium]
MKKLILKLLKQHYVGIIENWIAKILKTYRNKLTEAQIRTFVKSSLNITIEVIDKADYTIADQYLIEIYNLFREANLNLLEVSQVFSAGRYAILNFIENDESYKDDPLILLGFLDEIFEQIFARYGMLHQEAQMRQLESDRDRLASKLDINQRNLKNILHVSDSAIMILDADEKITSWNKGAEHLFGYSENEVLGKQSSFLMPDEEKYKKELEYIKLETRSSGYVKLTDTERVTKTGRRIWVDLSVAKLPSDDGNYIGRTVIIKDYTEMKRLQQQVDQSEKLAVIGQLAAGVAHEIGNPLTSISSLVQILQRKTKEEFTSQQLAIIKENIDRITRIVRELVDFSRTPSHDKQFIQITDVIKTALGIVKYDKRVKRVDFITSFDPNIPAVKIVPDQLLQVFVNILINSLDAINGEGKIEVTTNKDDEYIYIEITDDGCGMDEETVNKIFNPFFTTKEVGKGTGLGLSVSYGIIKKFKGDIIVDSQINEGSKFLVKIPMISDEDN